LRPRAKPASRPGPRSPITRKNQRGIDPALLSRMWNTTTVERWMTPTPHTIGRDIPITTAHAMMRDHGVRHLPVLDGGTLVGVLSERDLFWLETIAGTDAGTTKVEEAMTAAPYVVDRDASLRDVANEMARRRIGTALVADQGKVVGIFTAVDALRALVETL
jgi:acetoin utilization protein AcuB